MAEITHSNNTSYVIVLRCIQCLMQHPPVQFQAEKRLLKNVTNPCQLLNCKGFSFFLADPCNKTMKQMIYLVWNLIHMERLDLAPTGPATFCDNFNVEGNDLLKSPSTIHHPFIKKFIIISLFCVPPKNDLNGEKNSTF